jgi:hypothetical protein
VARLPIMPSTPFAFLYLCGAPFHNSFSGFSIVSNVSCWDRLLCQSLLLAYILSGVTGPEYYPVRCPLTPTHHHTNIHRHRRGYCSCKVSCCWSFADIRTGKYNPVIWAGFALWTLGLGLQTTFNADIGIGKIIGYLIINGFGIGMTFQTSFIKI